MRHVIIHPITLIGSFGLGGYLKLLMKCAGSKEGCFADFLFM